MSSVYIQYSRPYGLSVAVRFTYYIKLAVAGVPIFFVATGRYAPTFLNFSAHKAPETKVSSSAA